MPKLDLFFIFKKIFTLLLILALLIFPLTQIYADETECNQENINNVCKNPDKLNECNSLINNCQKNINDLKGKQQTLASTIIVLDNQIYLTTVQIQLKEKEITTLETEIEDLSRKILQLDTHLETTSVILKERIEETYKRMYVPSVQLMFMSNNFSDFYSRIKYLQTAQKHDKELMFAMEETKQNFDKQKLLKEEKQLELEKLQSQLKTQSKVLANQKYAKEDLLRVTKNDEKSFQQILAQARNEFEQIQAIIAGRGEEEEIRKVTKGEKIASVITGSSCNSSGTHLHFTVAQGGNALNPFSYLSSIDHDNCSGGGACSEGDPFNPSGSWDWPLSPKIRMNQGFGTTWAINNTWVGSIYRFHNGIDIIGSSNDVKTVQDGTLYRGSYGGSGGCRLRYVRVDHKDSDLETYYLHVNY